MNPSPPPLQLANAEMVYGGPGGGSPIHALRKTNLEIRQGRVTGLVGANGAGKTTLLELAVGALRPTSGALFWFGSEALDRKARCRIGFCADIPAIPAFLEVREALDFVAGIHSLVSDERRGAVNRCLELLELSSFENRRVGTLSRGNLVRLGIAQALLPGPDLLVLDESLSPLDPGGQRAVRALLRDEAARGCAVLVSSHQLHQVERLADGILMMDEGRISDEFIPGARHGTLESALQEFIAQSGSSNRRDTNPPRRIAGRDLLEATVPRSSSG